MHQASVIPYQQLAGFPAMFVSEIGMHGERVQCLDQRPSLGVTHADDVFGVIAEIQTVTKRFGMRPDHWVVDGRRRKALCLGHGILAVPPGAGKVQVVHGAQIVDSSFPRRIKPIVRTVHVAEMRVAPDSGDHFSIDDRRLAGNPAP